MKNLRHQMTLGLLAASLATLTACGGGSGADSTTAADSTVRGVAATGLAIANGQVSLKCAIGNSNVVTTQADGSYSIDVSKLTLPCVARVEYLDATGKKQKLHSLVQGVGIVNLTPVTDMVVANLSSTGVSADAYDKFSADEVKTYSEDRVKTAISKVKSELIAKGVDVSRLPDDAIRGILVAATASSKGNDHDNVLDDLKDKLEAEGKSLDDLEDDMHSGHESRGLSTSNGLPGDAAKGKVAYDANCKSCHGTRESDAVNAAKILKAIKENEGRMGSLAGVITVTVADDIATYMANGSGSTAGTALKTQAITFTSPGNQTLGVSVPTLTASATSGLPVVMASSTPAVCKVNGSTLTLVAAGTCTVSASQNGNTSYSAAAAVVHSFSVAAATGAILPTQTISFTSPGAQKVGTPVTLSASSNSGLTVTFASTTTSVCTISGNTLTLVAAGNCIITADQAGNSGFSAAATVTRTIAVANPAVAVSATNGKALYASNNCGMCHGAVPATNKVLLGANNPARIQSAITGDAGGMGVYKNLTGQNLADIAAYLMTPAI